MERYTAHRGEKQPAAAHKAHTRVQCALSHCGPFVYLADKINRKGLCIAVRHRWPTIWGPWTTSPAYQTHTHTHTHTGLLTISECYNQSSFVLPYIGQSLTQLLRGREKEGRILRDETMKMPYHVQMNRFIRISIQHSRHALF